MDADTRIAIIGAGAAGLSAAYYLKKRGYQNVVVYEQSDRVGGKCLSFDYQGEGYDLGFHEMGGGYYDVTQLAREVGVPTGGNQSMMVFDKKNHQTIPFRKFAKAQSYSMSQQLAAMFRYTRLLLFRYRKFQQPGTGMSDAPEDLCQPIVTWMHQHRLEAIRYIFSYIMRNQGYGAIDDLAAGYWVKFQGLMTFITVGLGGMGLIKTWPRIFPNGSQMFWEVVSSHVNVKLNHRVNKVTRGWQGEDFVVTVETAAGATAYDQLIIATEVDLETLSYLDCTPDETDLFSQIRYDDIWSTAAEVEGLPHGIVTVVPVPAIGGFTGYIKDNPDRNMAVFYSLTEQDQTAEDVNQHIEAEVREMPRFHGIKPSVKLPPLLQRQWKKYFPHVSPSRWAAGYYKQIEALQGQQHTHYVGGAFSFEILGPVVSYSKRLVYYSFPKPMMNPIPVGILLATTGSAALIGYMILRFAKISAPLVGIG